MQHPQESKKIRFGNQSSHIYAPFVVVVGVVGVVVVVVGGGAQYATTFSCQTYSRSQGRSPFPLTHRNPKGPVSGRGPLMLKLVK